MTTLSTLSAQITKNEPISPHEERFVRQSGPYNIANIAGPAKTSNQRQLNGRKTALICGAGIAGLAAAFELVAKGFEVTVAEKRAEFSRYNIINLSPEVQAFLRKFNLLEEFESSVAARIQDHRIVLFGSGEPKLIDTSDVSQLQFEGSLPRDPNKFTELFQKDGIYSVQIKDLQAFLAQKAVKLGVKILSDLEMNVVVPIEQGRVSKVELVQKQNPSSSLLLEPDLFLIADGAHSTSARQLGMVNDQADAVQNACTGENWIFGNLQYKGDKTFVISMIITAQKTLQIANVIFNAKNHVVNVAVTTEGTPNQLEIERQILVTAQKAFDYAGVKEDLNIIEAIKQPVRITNQKASLCSMGNVFRIGDAVGNSSPLAGLGGTLGLTLVPLTVERLVEDYQIKSDKLHSNFKTYSQAYVSKWIDKSQSIKGFIQVNFAKEQPLMEPKENKEADHANK